MDRSTQAQSSSSATTRPELLARLAQLLEKEANRGATLPTLCDASTMPLKALSYIVTATENCARATTADYVTAAPFLRAVDATTRDILDAITLDRGRAYSRVATVCRRAVFRSRAKLCALALGVEDDGVPVGASVAQRVEMLRQIKWCVLALLQGAPSDDAVARMLAAAFFSATIPSLNASAVSEANLDTVLRSDRWLLRVAELLRSETTMRRFMP